MSVTFVGVFSGLDPLQENGRYRRRTFGQDLFEIGHIFRLAGRSVGDRDLLLATSRSSEKGRGRGLLTGRSHGAGVGDDVSAGGGRGGGGEGLFGG